MDKEKLVVTVETEEKEIDCEGVAYIEQTTYRVFNDGSKEIACTARFPKPTDDGKVPPKTQLDRIEENVTAILGNASALDVLLGV